MFSVRSLFCYKESASSYIFSPSRRASVRIIIGCAASIGPFESAGLAPSFAASSSSAPASPFALTVGPFSPSAGGSSRSPGQNLSIIETGICCFFVLAQRCQCAVHKRVLFKSIGDIKINYRKSCCKCKFFA